jgi:hypothetical protein
MPALHDLLADDSSSGPHLQVLAGARGEILWRVGGPDVLRMVRCAVRVVETLLGTLDGGTSSSVTPPRGPPGRPSAARLRPLNHWNFSGTNLPRCLLMGPGCR